MDTWGILLSVLSFLAAVVSTVIAFRAYKRQQELSERANELQEENNRIQAGEKFLGWNEVEKHANVLFQQIEKKRFCPRLYLHTP